MNNSDIRKAVRSSAVYFIWKSVRDSVGSSVGDSVWDYAWSSVARSVSVTVGDSVSDSAKNYFNKTKSTKIKQ